MKVITYKNNWQFMFQQIGSETHWYSEQNVYIGKTEYFSGVNALLDNYIAETGR